MRELLVSRFRAAKWRLTSFRTQTSKRSESKPESESKSKSESESESGTETESKSESGSGTETVSESGTELENGSAVLEFVLIATPLFIPALLFFMSMQQVANQEMQVENLARQALRAFTTAESVAQGHQRINFVLDRYSEMESSNGKSRSSDKFTYNISCGGQKCLTPGSTVKIELYRAVNARLGEGDSRKVTASAVGVVDKWRQ